MDVLLYGGAGCTSALGNFRFYVDIFRLHFVFKDPLGLKYYIFKAQY